jgi:hypothetical protein
MGSKTTLKLAWTPDFNYQVIVLSEASPVGALLFPHSFGGNPERFRILGFQPGKTTMISSTRLRIGPMKI